MQPNGPDAGRGFGDSAGAPTGRLELATQVRDDVDAPDAQRALERLAGKIRREGRFVSDVSHELRSPIAGLRAQLEEAQLHPEETSLHDVLARALSDVDRLEAIVTDLLLLAHIESGAPRTLETVDLAELVRTEVSRRTDRLADQLRLEPGVTVSIVRTQISRVLTNLLNNAQRHAEGTVMVAVRRNDGSAELTVSDDGAGIAEDDREKIFERFTRLPAARSRDCAGTGLGLAISRDIAHAHSGTLQVGDSADGGAIFALRLPLA
jgi:signal transduction histidine kinase